MSRVLLKVREFGYNHRNIVMIAAACVIILSSAFAAGAAFAGYSNNISKGLADNLIRLHVIANSDSVDDQQLKLNVRDSILLYMKGQLKNSRDTEQTKSIINSNMDNIIATANKEIAKHGKNYEVKAMLGSYPFPTKVYGDVTLPAGYYQALRIVIGKGEGANWWCVLFPPLCFVDATHGTVPEAVKQNLKKTLTKEEYSIITTADSDSDIPVRIRFKIVEFFQDSRIKFSGVISKLFK